MAKRRDSQPAGGGATMQIDALVEEMEEVAAPDLANLVGAPPPLPPKKASKSVWLVGAVVVLVAAGLAVGVGVFLMGEGTPAASNASAASNEAPAPQEAPIQGEAEATDEAGEPAHADEGPSHSIQLEDVVFGDAPEGD